MNMMHKESGAISDYGRNMKQENKNGKLKTNSSELARLQNIKFLTTKKMTKEYKEQGSEAPDIL